MQHKADLNVPDNNPINGNGSNSDGESTAAATLDPPLRTAAHAAGTAAAKAAAALLAPFFPVRLSTSASASSGMEVSMLAAPGGCSSYPLSAPEAGADALWRRRIRRRRGCSSRADPCPAENPSRKRGPTQRLAVAVTTAPAPKAGGLPEPGILQSPATRSSSRPSGRESRKGSGALCQSALGVSSPRACCRLLGGALLLWGSGGPTSTTTLVAAAASAAGVRRTHTAMQRRSGAVALLQAGAPCRGLGLAAGSEGGCIRRVLGIGSGGEAATRRPSTQVSRCNRRCDKRRNVV